MITSPSPTVHRQNLGNERVVWTIDSGRSGPTIGLTANIHGDECTGVVVLNRVLEKAHFLEYGRLRIFPSLNPEGLKEAKRESPELGKDLNRLFPNCLDDNPSVHYELSAVWKALQFPALDFVMDIHSDSGLAMPYVLIDRSLSPNPDVVSKMVGWAEATKLLVLWEYPISDYRRFQLQRSLSGAVLNSLEIPCVTLEIGRRRHVEMSDVQSALSVIGRLLQYAGCMSAETVDRLGWTANGEPKPRGVWRRGNGPITRMGGLVAPVAKLGTILKEGDSIATIIDAQGKTCETVWAKEVCVIIAFPDIAWVTRWTSICTVAVLESS